MAGKPDSKLKLLYLKKILEEESDEEHILNAVDIATMLYQRYGIECERKSIYKDVEVLEDSGLDVVKTLSPKKGYFVASREFEPVEIRLLSDAVQAADFITKKKTQEMLKKIEGLTSVHQAAILKKQVYIDKRIKSRNESVFYSIDKLDEAIRENKKVSFVYTKRKLDEKFAARKERKTFRVSPYGLIWTNDHYYLVANNEKYDNLMNVRVDRISSVELLIERARPISEVSGYKQKFDPADYVQKTFNMFSGEPEMIELKCGNELLESMFDRFGESVDTRVADGDHFYLRTEASVNHGLVGWILQFGDGIEVSKPASLREMVAQTAAAVLNKYQ